MINPNGLVPTHVVYGMLPKLPASSDEFPDQQAHILVLKVSQREMETIVAPFRITQALRSIAPAAKI